MVFKQIMRKSESLSFSRLSSSGSNLLTIEDEHENAFLLEELHSSGPSVETIWLNIQFATESK